MLRWPSGVTAITEQAVAAPSAAVAVSNATPMRFMSLTKLAPSLSFFTLPMKAPRAPKEASPAMVLAADPPELSVASPIARISCTARNSSIRVMMPLAISCSSRKSSVAAKITSTIGLPMPATS